MNGVDFIDNARMPASSRRALVVLVSGIAACRSASPAAVSSVINLRVTLDHADTAEIVERDAVVPIEDSLVGLAGMTHVDAVSVAGTALVRASFSLGGEAALAAVRPRLTTASVPEGASVAVVPDAPATMRIEARSDTLPMIQVRELLESVLIVGLERLPGIVDARICGIGRPEITVLVDPVALAGLGLRIADVESALGSAPAFETVDALRAFVVVQVNGSPVRLGDLAAIVDSERPTDCWVLAADGSRRVEVTMRARDHAALVEAMRRLPALQAEMPQGISLEIDLDPAVRTAALPSLSDEEARRALGLVAHALPQLPGLTMRIDRSGASLPVLPDEVEIELPASSANPQTWTTIGNAIGQLTLASLHDPRAEVALTLSGDDPAALSAAADNVLAAARKLPAVGASGITGTQVSPQLEIVLDRPAMARLGLDVDEADKAIAIMREGRTVAHIQTGSSTSDVVLRIRPEKERDDPEILRNVLVGHPLVPLSTIASFTQRSRPVTLLRHDGKRAVKVWFTPGAEVDSGWRAELVRTVKGVPLPAGVSAEWTP